MLSRGTFTLVNFTNSSQIQDSDIKTLFFEANKLHAGLNKDPRPCHHALMSRFKILKKKKMLSRGTFTLVNFTNSSQIQDSDIKTLFFEANKLHAGLNKDPRPCHHTLMSRFKILRKKYTMLSRGTFTLRYRDSWKKKYSMPLKATFTSVNFTYNAQSKTVVSKHSL